MLLHYFYDRHLAQASYLIGCQATGDALVIDPSRDISRYVAEARRNNLRVVGAAETHIHADFVSGARELAERGATLYLSDSADEPWKYRYANQYAHRLLRDGDFFMVGRLRIDVLHTPGHTPEHLSFLLTDLPASETPLGIFTGDFVFVGSVGRPDLLEKAVGETGSAVTGAKQLFASLSRFRELPGHIQVLPGHGAGSACGKGMGAVPSSTVGYEVIANPYVRCKDEAAFVAMLLDGQPEPPAYFARMKRVNREGPPLLAEVTPPESVGLPDLLERMRQGTVVVDTRATNVFAKRHLPGSLNIPAGSLGEWAGWLVSYDQPIALILDAGSEDDVFDPLRAIGLDNVAAVMESTALDAAQSTGVVMQSYDELSPARAEEMLNAGDATLIDVRSRSEWEEWRLNGAHHIMLGTLEARLDEIPKGKAVIVQCRSGNRSAIAASILQANGVSPVFNLTGGIRAWEKQGLSIQPGGSRKITNSVPSSSRT